MSENTLPVDILAEQQLIGSTWSGLTLADAEARTVLWETAPETFFVKEHRLVWQGMRALVEKGHALSELALAWAVAVDGHATEASRAGILELLANGADLSPAPLRDRVLEMYRRRVAIRGAHEVLRVAADLTVPTDEVESAANAAFLEVAKGGGQKASPFWNALDLIETVQAGKPFRPHDANEKLLYTGIDWLDVLLTAAPGNVIIVAGRPGAGKSGLGLQARNVTAWHGVPCAFMSLEMSKEELDARDVAWWLSDPAAGRVYNFRDLLQGNYDAKAALALLHQQVPALQNAYGWAHSSGIAPGKLLAYMQEAVEVHGCRSLIIDYFQYIGVTRQKGDTLASAYGANSIAIKKFAQEHRVAIAVLSQLNRDTDNHARPVMSDLKETSQLEQDAQACAFLYRDKEDNLMFTMPKHRDGEKILENPLDVCWPCMRFSGAARETNPEQPGLY